MSNFERIVNVIPLTRVNLNSSQIFTYLVPLKLQDQIRPGQLVKIPFGRRMIAGVVSSFEMHRLRAETKGLKAIAELMDAVPVLTEKNLQLAHWLANFYVTSLGLAVKAMLPKQARVPKEPQVVGYERHNPDFILTEHQRRAATRIGTALLTHETFLLHGVTGSGKTEVYMQVIERLLPSGKQVIILVPEISLTDQAIERFSRRFGKDKIALIHSRLKASERYWMWQKIRAKDKQIIIGPRSAIFSPVQDLGLVVLDEEHDPSFKQADQHPKYNARTVARKLAELWQCPLILGDATPDVETYYEAVTGKIRLLNLPHRIKADTGFPKVQIVDMRAAPDGQKYGALSEFLKLAILENLKARRQILLFLNRRGAATFVMCRDCGYVPVCENCSVSLVWHSALRKLLCHHCGRSYPMPLSCAKCQGHRLETYGLGTQAAASELQKFLNSDLKSRDRPVIVRMDRDTLVSPETSGQIYGDWVQGKIDILIGTQIISKGWDVSRVGLVGIISADTMLNLPDFRSNERTFQVLAQVAGRTGRGGTTGLVILQTYHPDNYAIEAAKTHDYEKFFSSEIKERQKFHYPPFTRLTKLTVRHANQSQARTRARDVWQSLLSHRQEAMEILGPVPTFISRLRGKYQYQIILKFRPDAQPKSYEFLKKLPSDVDIDAEPDTLL